MMKPGWLLGRLLIYAPFTVSWTQPVLQPTKCQEQHSPLFSVTGNHQSRFQSQAVLGGGNDCLTDPPILDIYPLFISGDASNRVGLVFFSDGYALDERSKFIKDATQLAKDLSANQTFASVKPLLNFYAAFSPSNESGIGVGGKPKDTVYGLYRDGTELRAVYTSKPEVARAACDALKNECDYPILLGNDDLYGGLGGPFSITTSSTLNGALVLRHELGHSIIGVGEEYDGGFAYFGYNSSPNTTNLKWSHWLTDQEHSFHDHGISVPEMRHERAVMSLQSYPWAILNHTSPFRAEFTSSGTYSHHLVRFSLSGLPLKSHLQVTLDGKDINWVPRPGIGVDRWHYDIYHEWPLTDGSHRVEFWLGADADASIAQLCSVEILEYGSADEFNRTPGVISAFPTFSLDNVTTFRPTNEQCLMRLVTEPNFCSPCLEGLWLKLLQRVNLIDGLVVEHTNLSNPGSPRIKTQLQLVPLGAFRRNQALFEGEGYEIHWKQNGQVIHEATNSTSLVSSWAQGDIFDVQVRFHTPEVRKDVDGRLRAFRSFK